MKKLKQNGFAIVELLLIVAVILVLGGIVFYVFINKDKANETNNNSDSAHSIEKSEGKIKHLGVNLDYYDPATNKAGDFVFTKAGFSSGADMQKLFMNFGQVATIENQSRRNPQPTFILPLGTKVHSLVDGEVVDVPRLYSGDYSVMVQAQNSQFIFETEHIKNVTVKKGDRVKAGDIVGEVSDYDAKNYAGMGLVEIGILQGGNPPKHICPFDYLDESIKEETLKKITALQKSWEEYRGDATIYDETKVVIPGCESREAVEG